MISYQQAIDLLIQNVTTSIKPVESIPLQEAVGFVCAEDVRSSRVVPPFDNAAMDGFAICQADGAGRADHSSFILKKVGVVAAGDSCDTIITPGTCIQVMTGAPVPKNSDQVIPVELVTDKGEDVIFSSIGGGGTHIRRAGEDIGKGQILIKRGVRIETQHMMPLAAAGIEKVNVCPRPRAVFIATGRELVDNFSSPLGPGQIYNANRPYGVAALAEMGVDCIAAYTILDDELEFKKILSTILDQNVELIVSSGAVSAGVFDFVPKVLSEMGAALHYHKVRIKPGKPNLFATFPCGTAYFGLPGNPVATAVGLRFFVAPFVRAVQGMLPEQGLIVRSETYFKKKAPLQLFLKSRVNLSPTGDITVAIMTGQESFMVHPFLDMNAWAVMPEAQDILQVGDLVTVYPLSSKGINLTF